MTTVDPQEVIDRGLRLDPDRAAALAQRVLDAEQQVANVRALHKPVECEPSETICEECSTQRGSGENVRFFPFVEWPCETIAALDGQAWSDATPTPEPTIADHDGFAAPIMDHAPEPQPTDETRDPRWRPSPSCYDHECSTVCLRCDRIDAEVARQQEPVERITDDRGDEEEHGGHDPSECPACAARQQCSCLPRDAEATLTCPVHGADTDAEAANQPQCSCVPFPQGTGPEEDCPVHGAQPELVVLDYDESGNEVVGYLEDPAPCPTDGEPNTVDHEVRAHGRGREES